jgi:hypothetical protein
VRTRGNILLVVLCTAMVFAALTAEPREAASSTGPLTAGKCAPGTLRFGGRLYRGRGLVTHRLRRGARVGPGVETRCYETLECEPGGSCGEVHHRVVKKAWVYRLVGISPLRAVTIGRRDGVQVVYLAGLSCGGAASDEQLARCIRRSG